MGSCPDTDIDPKNLSETFCSCMYEANHDFVVIIVLYPLLLILSLIINFIVNIIIIMPHFSIIISLSSNTIHFAFSRIAEHLEESLPNLETIVMTSNNMQELVCLT